MSIVPVCSYVIFWDKGRWLMGLKEDKESYRFPRQSYRGPQEVMSWPSCPFIAMLIMTGVNLFLSSPETSSSDLRSSVVVRPKETMITLTLRCQKSGIWDRALVLRHSECPWDKHALRVAHTEPGLLSPLLELWCMPFLKGLLCHSTIYISKPAPQPSSALAVGFVQLRTRRRVPERALPSLHFPRQPISNHKMALS